MFPDFATDEAQSFHHKLARFNVIRMAPATPSSDWQATTRRYAYQAIGAFGVIELTAPERARKVAFGMQRLGLDGCTRAYFELHAVLDVAHARSWIAEVMRPLIKGYLRCGARLLGPPAVDVSFNTTDLPLMLRVNDLAPRYRTHFLDHEGCWPGDVSGLFSMLSQRSFSARWRTVPC